MGIITEFESLAAASGAAGGDVQTLAGKINDLTETVKKTLALIDKVAVANIASLEAQAKSAQTITDTAISNSIALQNFLIEYKSSLTSVTTEVITELARQAGRAQ